ncbi:LysR family transcriptional regulator [Brevibacterium sp. 2SA]|uniref:LysR family transcriptional regulator n=1 Tax=Brevibacterium sp. 2SA TaxID=2502198 RepID=UPI0010F629AA|nr:LysR family transcriptional regulator [Brevibacterium sp. 2SA]
MEVLDTRGLVALRAVADAGSVAAAATRLDWSQPTVNHHLANLERALGATLIERTPRGSHPTTVGSLVVTRAVEILGLAGRLVDEVALWRDSQAVPVKIGAVPTVGARVIPLLHHELQKRPRWQVGDDASATVLGAALDVTMDEHAKLVSRLEAGDLDLALLVSTDVDKVWIPPSLTARKLYSEQLFLCVPKAVGPVPIDPHGLPGFAALVTQSWAFSIDPGDAIDEVIRAFCLAAGFEPRVGMRMDDYAAINRMIAAGLAIAMIPESSLPTDPEIEIVPMPLSAARRDVLLVSRAPQLGPRQKSARHDPIVAAHSAAVAEVVADVRTVTAVWR